MGSSRQANLPSTSHTTRLSSPYITARVDVTMQWDRLLVLIVLCWLGRVQTNPVLEVEEDREQITILPYTFDLNPDTHHLQTSWEVSGASVSSVCAFGTVSMMEVGFTGQTEELSSGNSWAVTCQPSYDSLDSNKMEVEVDVTKFKVQPFRSYKVCISLDDYEFNWRGEPVCTHLFSFEKYVPYIPDTEQPEKSSSKDETDIKDETLIKAEKIEAAIESDSEDKTVEIESVLKHQLSNIEHFVRDDFKAQFNDVKKEMVEEFEVLEELEEKMLNSASGVERSVRVSVTSAICILLSRTLLLNML